MYRSWKISVVIPCYNEGDGIKYVMDDMPHFVDEVVVVDNNSTDNTAKISQELGAVVVLEPKQGYGAAYKTGLQKATGDVIVTMDGDANYPRNFISVLLDIMFDEDIDFISCDRTGHKDRPSPFLRIFGNCILSTVMNLLFFIRVSDSQSGMWVFKRHLLDKMKLTSDKMAFSEEIKIEAFTNKSIRAKELPIYCKNRVGNSKLRMWRDGLDNLVFLFKKRAMTLIPRRSS
jgi:glycosyltransferase involved in cell wall biosynthesis